MTTSPGGGPDPKRPARRSRLRKQGDAVLEPLRQQVIAFLDRLSDPKVTERVRRLDNRLNEFGVDPFGFNPDFVRYAIPFVCALYKHYFRVQTYGIENVPKGRVLLISNHSGQIPLDAMMIVASMVLEAEPPRMVRSMVDSWVPTLPVLSWFFPRTGQIVGTRENCQLLLDREEPILAFPEGTKGINKLYSQRYQLQEFGLGFMRLALSTRAPIVPVAVVGAEEQAPAIYNARGLARLVGAPNLPLTVTFPWLGPLGLLPLPSKYRIYFGSPMSFSGDPDDEDAVVAEKVKGVRRTIQRMLRDGLKSRKHVFW
jgi:1-acyl-sn-glycerol-3-phosphate acyltransferase